MTVFETYLGVLGKFLAASLIVERFLEFLDKILSFLGLSVGRPGSLQRLLGLPVSGISEEERRLRKRLIMQTLGIAAGVGICYSGKLGVFTNLGIVSAGTPPLWDMILSGLLISGGSEPIHQLMTFVTEKKDQLKAQRLELEAQQASGTPGNSLVRFAKIKISYDGGLYPNTPGHGLRRANPKYIVIHHSKTSAKLSFQEIVEIEKKERSNDRGTYVLDPSYHCVITYDGKYHNYCRWDSVGWHVARGKRISNGNSLGICFVGDFDVPSDRQSNQRVANAKKPSEAQINTGARMIALWRILYGIEEKNVVPHSRVKANMPSCPGNNFPLDRLIAKSTHLMRQWQKDPQILKELEEFKKLNYIYVKPK